MLYSLLLALSLVGGERTDERLLRPIYAPLVDLHAMVCALEEQPEAEVPDWIAPAVEAARRVSEEFGGREFLFRFSPLVEDASTARELSERCAQLPETLFGLVRRGGSTFASRHPWRRLASDYAAGLATVETRFLESVWPEREDRIQTRIETLEVRIGDGRALLSRAAEALGLGPSSEPYTLMLFEAGPRHFIRCAKSNGTQALFVPLTSRTGAARDDSELLFLALHEILHRLDELPGGVLQRLRESFEVDLEEEMAWHGRVRDALLHLIAEERVREHLDLDPDHPLPRLEPRTRASEVARSTWARVLRGEQSSEAGLAELIRACCDP